MTNVLNAAVRQLIDSAQPAVLATINPDGSPQTSVLWVGRDGDDLVLSSQEGRRKVLNLRRAPRASLTVFDQVGSDLYVEVRGTATVTEDVGRSLAVALAEKYEGPGAGQEYLALPPEAVRVVIRIASERATGSAAAG